jgi:molybdopterin molybdotransferase
MGRFDHMRGIVADLGCEEVFWRVNQQPGGPMLFARKGATLVFGLPGNPVSALFCADLYLKPALARFAGFADHEHTVVPVRIGQALRKSHGKAAFVRGVLAVGGDRELVAVSTGRQESNIIRSVVAHDGYIVLAPEARELAEGDAAQFIVTNAAAFARLSAELLGARCVP